MSQSPQSPAPEESPRPDPLKKYKDFAARLWNPPRDKFLMRLSLGLFTYAFVMTGVTTVKFYKFISPGHPSVELAEEHGEDSHVDSHEVAESGHGESHENEPVALGASPFPKSITSRKKGFPEEGHDLVEPEVEITRDIASLIKEDLKVSVGARFVEIPEVTANPKAGTINEGSVQIDLALEVGNNETRDEIESRRTEIKALVGSIGSTFQKSQLRTTAGMLAYKQELQKQLNLLLVKGKVSDVLFSSYRVQ